MVGVAQTILYMKDTLQERQFYTRNSILKILSNKYNKIFTPASVSKALQKLKNDKVMKFDQGTKFWTVNPGLDSEKKDIQQCNCNHTSFAVDAQIVASLEKVCEKMVTKVADKIVATSLTQQVRPIITHIIQETILEEIRTELKPALHEYIDQRVKNGINANINNRNDIVNKALKSTRISYDQLERRIKDIEDIFYSLNQLLDTPK